MAYDPNIRASDADRDRAASLLREHHAAGRLTAEEFAERRIAAAAKTASDRKGFMSELPLEMPTSRDRTHGGPASQRIRQAQTVGGARER